MNNVKNRQITILEMLNSSNKLLIKDLLKVFGVSEMTLRRDIETLEKKGVIKKIKGGIVRNFKDSSDIPFEIRNERRSLEKIAIAKKAASLIQEGETIVIDNGTTALAFANEIKDIDNLTVVTANLRVAWALSDRSNIKLILLGGIVKNGERSTYRKVGLETYENLFPDTFVMGASAISIDSGITDFDIEDATIKSKAIQAATRTIVIADENKLGKTAFAKIADLNAIDVLITNKSLSKQIFTELQLKKVTVILA
ncbi:DeoR/GlpR family DNA-binding transcription regulator [Psychrobacillus antarcticus]|uniref:DeoR/GlpR family DNA-binding transcription regulator n=1 Tax=Psychrobacillus antarcticus TaxID=2879115 RepID=UPI002407D0B1|nr:DeoR/GlpR family DNA-binding transcription regulator [Psychrobacillus antarcticus]